MDYNEGSDNFGVWPCGTEGTGSSNATKYNQMIHIEPFPLANVVQTVIHEVASPAMLAGDKHEVIPNLFGALHSGAPLSLIVAEAGGCFISLICLVGAVWRFAR